jgi:hypothetical protein
VISTSRVSRRRRRRPRRKKKNWTAIIISLLIVIFLVVGVAAFLGYNPLTETRLREQLGESFFSDFGVNKPVGAGSDLESVINNYEPIFTSLQDEALKRLDSLLITAMNDYKRQESEGTLDRFVLTNKYIQAGRMLESGVDEVFYDLLGDLKTELAAIGYPDDLALEIEETYLEAKDAKKRELFDRLRREIGQ